MSINFFPNIFNNLRQQGRVVYERIVDEGETQVD